MFLAGKYEAIELRDNNDGIYMGKGVLKAVNNIQKNIKNHLIGTSIHDQLLIDNKMIQLDGTFNKGNLGANALLAVSIACNPSLKASISSKISENIHKMWRSEEAVNNWTEIFLQLSQKNG